MADVIIVPRVKTEIHKIHIPISKCGDNWWKDVRVRAPFKGTDRAYRTLPSLGEPSQVEHVDPEFLEEILGDHERVTKFVEKHFNTLSDRQRKNVSLMLDRCKHYIAAATLIWKSWASGFTTSNVGQVPPWPLNGQPKGAINGNIEEGHKRDVERWKKLVRAALRNLRCAEEVAKKATIRARNRRRHKEGRRYGGVGEAIAAQDHGMSYAPAPTEPPPPEDELDEGEIDLESLPTIGIDLSEDEDPTIAEEPLFEEEAEAIEIEETLPPAPAKKKKDNTLLVAGAAALGVLVLARR